MTPKQILDSFSETLVQDERILSAQERALVTTLVQHARTAANGNQETQAVVRGIIASAVGETVAQRAFAVLGGSIVQRILEGSLPPQSEAAGLHSSEGFAAPKQPQLPHMTMGEPDPPSVGPGVRAPRKPEPEKHPVRQPQPPSRPLKEQPEPPTVGPGPGVRAPRRDTTTQPEPPTHGITTTVVSKTNIAVAERPQVLPARCVVLDEFLAPQEVQELIRFTLEHEADFVNSEVVSPNVEQGLVNYDHRRSRVLMDLAEYQDIMLHRIRAVLPAVLGKLGMEEFAVTGVEAQITASNDGDFFHFHSDNGSDRVASRHLTFVYFFHREPRQFEGGELRIHDARLEEDVYVSDGSYQTIVPRQNQIVFFPCELMHEITPVSCSSQLFAESRFTLNGWLRR